MIANPIDLEKAAHIYARFEDGVFTDLDTNLPVKLKEGCIAKIIVDEVFLEDEQLSNIHSIEVKKQVLTKGNKLEFKLQGTPYAFIVTLIEDLVFVKKENKLPVASRFKIKINQGYDEFLCKQLPGFSSIEVNSLNQAYFKMSIKYKPEAQSHAINVYTNFYIAGKPLEILDKLRSF